MKELEGEQRDQDAVAATAVHAHRLVVLVREMAVHTCRPEDLYPPYLPTIWPMRLENSLEGHSFYGVGQFASSPIVIAPNLLAFALRDRWIY